MGQTYMAGQTMNRPGVYQRSVNRGTNPTAGVTENSVAIPIQADWGPVDMVTVHETVASVTAMYGTNKTVDAAIALLEGGAPRVYCIRLNKATTDTTGTEAKQASLELIDAESGSTAATITAKYPGTKEIKVQTRIKVEGASKEILVYSGTTQLEAIPFAIGTGANEVANLVAAVASSAYITATAGEGTTVPVKDLVALTGGVDPTITTASYTEALNKLEVYKFTHIALDTVDTTVQAVLKTWVDRVYKDGKWIVAVFGGNNKDVTFTNLTAASIACDDKKNIYWGHWGYNAEGAVVDGYKMAAYVAGAIANTPSNKSIVHTTVPGIVSIVPFTNSEYSTAIESGLLLASYSPSGAVWFDSGVNTLVTLDADEDAGWKKIRRVATRFELFRRLDEALSTLVGKVNCDNDGIAQAVQKGMGVINAMVTEDKLHAGGSFYEDPENPHGADSAWFIIDVDDIDSLEKIYLKYQFRFSTNS